MLVKVRVQVYQARGIRLKTIKRLKNYINLSSLEGPRIPGDLVVKRKSSL